MQVKPQKSTGETAKEVQKEQPIQKEKPVENRLLFKTTCDRKTKPAEKENTKFSVNVLPTATTTNKTEKEYKISDVIKRKRVNCSSN